MTDSGSERTNHQWLDQLQGVNGMRLQEIAHIELADILYIRVFNYLRRRQRDIDLLSIFDAEEVGALAQDFVQETLVKIASNNFALLHMFHDKGKFVNWCATILYHEAGAELRRPYWRKRGSEMGDSIDPAQEDPEHLVQASFVLSIIEKCLSQLPQRQRIAFEQSILHDSSGTELAERLDTSKDAVYQLVCRARANLRTCIEKSGIGREILELFGE